LFIHNQICSSFRGKIAFLNNALGNKIVKMHRSESNNNSGGYVNRKCVGNQVKSMAAVIKTLNKHRLVK
jgi:hypothetical protein